MFHPTEPSESGEPNPAAPQVNGGSSVSSRPAAPLPADTASRAREEKAIAFLRQVESLPEPELLSRLRGMVVRERRSTTQLLAHLAVVDMRRSFVPQGHSSLFNYCTRALHFSEQAAYLRIAAARVVRRFPAVLARVADGSVHLTALALLRPHLTGENHRRLLDAARHRSRREIEDLVASWRVGPPDPPRARFDVLTPGAPRQPERGAGGPLPFHGDFDGHDGGWRRRPDGEQGWWRHTANSVDDDAGDDAASASRYVENRGDMNAPRGGVDDPGLDVGYRLDFGNADDDDSSAGREGYLRGGPPAGHLDAGHPRPDGPEPVYRLHITIPAETRRKLDQAAELLRHQIPDGDPARIIDRALGVLLDRLEQRKFARVLARPQAGIGVRPAVMPMTGGSEVGEASDKATAGEAAATETAGGSPGKTAGGSPGEAPGQSPAIAPAPGSAALGEPPAEADAPASEAPVEGRPGTRRGHIPSVIRRAVWKRDGGRCTFVGAGGERCDQVGLLEYHHRKPWAAGGPDTFDNLELRCRPHNDYESEMRYGRTAHGTPTHDDRAFDPLTRSGHAYPGIANSSDGGACIDDPGVGDQGVGDQGVGDQDVGDQGLGNQGNNNPGDGDPTRFGPSST